MFKALRWTTRSLRTHSWPRTQEERQRLEAIIDRKVPLSFPVPFSEPSLKRIRAEEKRQLKAANTSPPPCADTGVSIPPPHNAKVDSIPQLDSVQQKRWIPTFAQLQVLLAVFQESPLPSSALCYELSERLQVPLKSIFRWFVNRRSRAGLHSYLRIGKQSSFEPEAFGERPTESVSSFTPRATRISDRPPLRTLDLSQVTASDFMDLSGTQYPYVPVIVGSETLIGKPGYDMTKGRRVAFPAGTTGFLYVYSPTGRPAYERSIRFKLVPSIDCLDDLHNRSDLLRRDGLPWSIPLYAEDGMQRAFVAKAVHDGFITEDMHRQISSLVNKSPRAGWVESILIHDMSQVFAVPLDRGSKMTIWIVTDETKIRINVKTEFLENFKRKRDGSDAACAHVSIKSHPVYNAPAFVVESIQESKGSPQVKVPTPKYTLLNDVLIKRTEYKITKPRASST